MVLIVKKVGFLLLVSSAALAAEMTVDSLGPAGKAAYEKHQRLFNEVVPKHRVQTKVQVNSGGPKKTSIVKDHRNLHLLK